MDNLPTSSETNLFLQPQQNQETTPSLCNKVGIAKKLLATVQTIDCMMQYVFHYTLFKLPGIATHQASFYAESDPTYLLPTVKIIHLIERLFRVEHEPTKTESTSTKTELENKSAEDYQALVKQALSNKNMEEFIDVIWTFLTPYTTTNKFEKAAYHTLYSIIALKNFIKGNPTTEEDCKKLHLSTTQFEDVQKQIHQAFNNLCYPLTDGQIHLLFVAVLYRNAFKMQNLFHIIFPNTETEITQTHHTALAQACTILLNPSSPLHQSIAQKLPLLKHLPPEDIAILLAVLKKRWRTRANLKQLFQGELPLQYAKQFRWTPADKETVDSSQSTVDVLKLSILLEYFDSIGTDAILPPDKTHTQRIERIKTSTPTNTAYPAFKKIIRTIDKAPEDEDDARSIYELYLLNQSVNLGLIANSNRNLTDEVTPRICCMLRIDKQNKKLKQAVSDAILGRYFELTKAFCRRYEYCPELFQAAVPSVTDNPTYKESATYTSALRNALIVLVAIEHKANELLLNPEQSLHLQAVAQAFTKKMDVKTILQTIDIDPNTGVVSIT